MSVAPHDPVERLAAALTDVIRQAIAEAAVQMGNATTGDVAELVDVQEAARRLGLGTTTLKRLLAAGELQSVLVGRRRLVPVSGIAEYGARLTAKSAG